MSRQQKRANERRKSKTAFQKICLAAGEGVGRAVAFSFALASNAFAAEPKKEEPIRAAAGGRARSKQPVHRARILAIEIPVATPRDTAIDHHRAAKDSSKNRPAPLCAMRCAMCPASLSPPAKAAAHQGDVFILRGFNARNDTYLDGVRDSGSYFRDSFNLDSVEVLKGPSSTFFGRGSTGGVINQVSKRPRLDPSYEGIFSGGSGPLFRGTVDINQPLPQTLPNAALRLNLMAHSDDIVGRDRVDLKRMGFAPSISFGLGTPTQLTLSYLLQHEDNIPDYGFPYVNGKPLRIDRNNFYGLSKEDTEETWLNVGTARLDHRFNDMFNVRSTTRYSYVDRHSAVTNPTAILPNTLNRSRPERDTQETIFSNQTDLTARFDTWGMKHTATTGLELSNETFDVLRWASKGPNTTINHPNHDQLPASENCGGGFRHKRYRFWHLCGRSDQAE